MRRRLLAGTLTIALVCVAMLGAPLALLAHHEVWTSARDRLHDQAAVVAISLEDRLDSGHPVDVNRYLPLMPGRRIVVRPAHGPAVAAGPPLTGRLIQATVAVSDNTITVQASSAPTVARARKATLVVVALVLFVAVASVGLALWQASRLGLPIAQLAARADELGRGQFRARHLHSGIPEIDRVSEVLERSTRQIGIFIDLQRNFASDAAHQLRTPLTSIGLHLDEICRVGDRPVRAEADDALTQVERLDGVITSLLARTRGESADPTVLDLGDLVRDGSAPWERILAGQDRLLVLELSPAVSVLARRDNLLSILASLLDNAVAHGGGTVTVTVERVKEAVCLRVTDEGPGVAPDLAARIFDRRVSGGSGTGIGLALAHSLAVAESGTLTVSEHRQAEFVLSLPRQRIYPATD